MMMGFTPQVRDSWRCTCSSMTQATMGVSGRKRLMSRGVAPLLVTVMIAEALVSVAVVQAAWAVAPPMPRRMSGVMFRIRPK